MQEKRILTIQDISCFGQCSITVALPILSAAGFETSIIPSAVLSTHTGGFKGYTFCDLTPEIRKISDHWLTEAIKFNVVYSGYLGNIEQINQVKLLAARHLKEGGLLIVDPAMADYGKLYPGFDAAFVEEMKKLAFSADIIIPNITEACLLTGIEYKETYNPEYIEQLLMTLRTLGAKKIVLTGVSYSPLTMGVAVYEHSKINYYEHKRIEKGCHGTGDVYSSSFIGAYLKGHSLFNSAKIAANYVVKCIENTITDPTHWYGVKFESELPMYMNSLEIPDQVEEVPIDLSDKEPDEEKLITSNDFE